MSTIRRVAEDVGWVCLALAALAAAPFVFSYVFFALMLQGSLRVLPILPFEHVPETLVIGSTMIWVSAALAMSLGFTGALLFGVARAIGRFRTPSPELHGPRKPPIRR